MEFFWKRVSVRPNCIGYLYRKNKFRKKLRPGIYGFFDLNSEIDVVILPTISKILIITNQEVLTKDNIALRFSYIIEYKIENGDRFLSRFDAFQEVYGSRFGRRAQQNLGVLHQAEQVIHSLSQVYLREEIAKVESELLNEQRSTILNTIPEALQSDLGEYGIVLQQLMVRDITFPKSIQDLFAKQLEAKIRAKADLENARTAVATARALKNASELMKGDDNVRFFQFLETITKIASKGNHTFVLGELSQGIPNSKRDHS